MSDDSDRYEAITRSEMRRADEYQEAYRRAEKDLEKCRIAHAGQKRLQEGERARADRLTEERDCLRKDVAVWHEIAERRYAILLALGHALTEARPYVFNRTRGEDWRAETATEILARVDLAIADAMDYLHTTPAAAGGETG